MNAHCTHINKSCHTYERYMAHIWMKAHRTRTNEARLRHAHILRHAHMNAHTHTSHTQINAHCTHMNKSCRTYEWDMSHIWTGHVIHMNESCHTYERDMSYIWTGHVIHTHERSSHTYQQDTSHTCAHSAPVTKLVTLHIWKSHVTHMNESCHTYKRIMSNTCAHSTPLTTWE